MENDKKRLVIMAILTVTLLAGAVLFGYKMVLEKEITLPNIASLIVPVVLIVFMIFFIGRRYKDVSKGMPLEDERSKNIMNRVAAMSFYTSLYWLLAISMFEPFFAKVLFSSEKLDASQTTGGAIAGMAIFFAIYWIYYNHKGNISN